VPHRHLYVNNPKTIFSFINNKVISYDPGTSNVRSGPGRINAPRFDHRGARGRLRARANEPWGAVFQFTLPPQMAETVPAEHAGPVPVVSSLHVR